MTLVLDDSAAPVRSLWAQMDATALVQAREDLRARESIPKSAAAQCIGSWSLGEPSPANIVELEPWAQSRGVQHVIWTALPAKFADADVTLTADAVLGYLRGLTGAVRDNAERYIRRAP